MVLPIVVNTDRKIAIDKSEYNHGMENGLFLTEDGSLGIKRKMVSALICMEKN